jgi:hypothetical protein
MKLQSHSSSVACLPPLTQRKTTTKIVIDRFPLRRLDAWLYIAKKSIRTS